MSSRPELSSRSDGLVFIPGGRFLMGSDRHYPDEGPAREVEVDDFWIEATPVANRQFAEFVEATGYVTLAERTPTLEQYPDARPDMLKAGSLVFTPPGREVDLRQPMQWWRFVFGADWRRPQGPVGPPCHPDHPVVHVAYEDAEAYAAWKGRALPTEAQWEFAARGGVDGSDYAWGEELTPGGRIMANTWFGRFPNENLKPHGFTRTSPVASFPPNGYGLYDIIGNVWEWTSDFYAPRGGAARSCCVPRNPRNDLAAGSADPRNGPHAPPRRVLKGGSHLCAENYCQRYRPAARHPQEVDSGTTHVGFRCVSNGPAIQV